jgi:hypothetical protein
VIRLLFWTSLLGALCLARPARADGDEPPTPTDFAVRLLVPSVGATVALGSGTAALIAWSYQYALDDLLLPRLRATLEPQIVLPATETIAFRLRAGVRWVPFMRGLMDESPRFFIGAGASLSSKVALSSELGWRFPYKWPLWTFFVALRGDWRFTGTSRYEAGLLTGFTIF